MQIVDLSLPIYNRMPVFPGDPEVKVEVIQTHQQHGWEMRHLEISGHDGTHVNAQNHMVENGKNLDAYRLSQFIGPATIYKGTIPSDQGVIFRDQNIDTALAEEIKRVQPKFVGLSSQFEFDIEIEKELLKADIICFERLANTEQLPDAFMFYGVPLNIKGGDGSPVRAFAAIN